jgi:hypothetical protein
MAGQYDQFHTVVISIVNSILFFTCMLKNRQFRTLVIKKLVKFCQ